MARCAHTYADSSQCRRIVKDSETYCYSHDPERAEERKLNASKGGKRAGRGRGDSELTAIKALLEDLTNRVLRVEGAEVLETGPAAVANQLINTRLRAIEQERRNKETEDLESRIEALERIQENQQREERVRPWRQF